MVKRSSGSSETIKVTVAQVGEAVITLVLEPETTVADALSKAGYEGHTARVNGEEVCGEDVLEDGDELFVGKNVKGGVRN
jgi:sulfur carrier protein ThiS